MMFRISIVTCLMSIGAVAVDHTVTLEIEHQLWIPRFREWKELYGKVYSDVDEEVRRAKVWFDNHSK